MQQATQPDELTMCLLELALNCPEGERQEFLHRECGGNSERYGRVWKYVEWDERMGDFLQDPFCRLSQLDSPFKEGQLLSDRFRVVREIARGGMGIVCEAIDERLQRRVAIKYARSGFAKQLPPEVRNAREIGHPNVCRIFEIHNATTPHGEIEFISMEFLEGETLSERLRRGPAPKKHECLSIATDLCAGLGEAHRHGVIHGDLKSNNVILASAPGGSVRPVIMDFGLAQRREASGEDPSAELVGGTPAYMAPELWKGVKPSVASDIYALGIIFWELVSGLRPVDMGVMSSTLSWDERPAWKPPTGYGKWDRVLARCLQVDPARRFQSAEEVVRALGPKRAHRWALAMAASLVLAISTGEIAYQRAAPAKDLVSLTMSPLESGADTAVLADELSRQTNEKLAQLKGDAQTKLLIGWPRAPTLLDRISEITRTRHSSLTNYTLHGALQRDHSHVVVHVYLSDGYSGVNAKEWRAEYEPQELRYAPTALAGVVTETLHLPPLAGMPETKQAAREYLREGRSLLGSDAAVEAAVASMRKAVAADPDSGAAQAGLAEALWFSYHTTNDQERLSQSIEAKLHAECRNPDLPEVHRVSGMLEKEAGHYPAAIVEYRRAIELEPDNGENYWRLGVAYDSNNQPNDSLRAFQQAAKLAPNNFRIQLDIGSHFFNDSEFEEASKHFRKAVQLAPNEPMARSNLAEVLLDMGMYDEAEREIRAAIRLRERPDFLITLGDVLMYKHRENAAIPFLSRAAALSPDNYLSWLQLGICYRHTGQSLKATEANLRGVRAAELEIGKNPHRAWVHSALAYLCVNVGEESRGKSELGQALSLNPDDTDVKFWAVLTYEFLHERSKTMKILDTAPSGTLGDVNRWPYLADLHKDPRFLNLLAVRGIR